MVRRLRFPALFLAAATVSIPLRASFMYTCGSGISSTVCATLNSSIAGLYTGTFNTFNSVNVNIYIQSGDVGLGESEFNTNGVSFASYVSQFTALSTDSAALASLPITEPDVTGDVFLTAAQWQALDFDSSGLDLGVETDGMTACALGTAGCYDGVITINTSLGLYYRIGTNPGAPDFYSIAEHETDEILGTASCMASVNDQGEVVPVYDSCTDANGDGVAPSDFYRISSLGGYAWINNVGVGGANFSLTNGATYIVPFNNEDNGGDLGDWAGNAGGGCAGEYVQTFQAVGGCSPDITTDPGTPEIQLLNAVGFNLNSGAPEPATFALAGASLAILAAAQSRKRRRLAARAGASTIRRASPRQAAGDRRRR